MRGAHARLAGGRVAWGGIALGVAVGLLSPLSPLPFEPEARAQDASDLARAREAFKQGLADEQAGKYDKAAGEFETARTLAQKETPQVLFHLGVCHARVGRLVAARGELLAAVERARVEGLDKVGATAKTELDRVAPRIATLTVEKPTTGAVTAMTLDRVDATAKVGAPIEVDPGPHDIHVEIAGAPPRDAHVTVGDGEKRDVVLPGERPGAAGAAAAVGTAAGAGTAAAPGAGSAPGGAPASDGAPASGAAPGSDATPGTPPEGAPGSESPPGGSRTLGWILAGGGAALLAGGAVFWVLRQNEINTLDNECGSDHQGCPASGHSNVDAGKLDDALGVTLFVAGGAAVLGGAGWLLFGPHGGGATPAAQWRVTPVVTAHGGGVGVQGVTW
jgi:hypothetical protein